MPPSDSATQNTPLAPSVEKAYYRKCIALKRRLNEIETANDEAKIRRMRLDRAIMKMRLERAFLLDELRRRMDHKVDDSEGSGEEAMATPPPDRPHRDKRRRQTPAQSANASPGSHHATGSATQSKRQATSESRSARGNSRTSDSKDKTSSGNAGQSKDGKMDVDSITQPKETTNSEGTQPRDKKARESATGHTKSGSTESKTNGDDREGKPVNREADATGESLSSGPTVEVDADGERRVVATDAAGDPMNDVEGPS